MVEAWQYLETQQQGWGIGRGVGEPGLGGGRGRQSPPPMHAGPGALSPQGDPCPPRSGRHPHFPIAPPKTPHGTHPSAEKSRRWVQRRDGSGWQRGGGVWAAGGGAWRPSRAGRRVRAAGADRSGETKSRPEKQEKRGGGGGGGGGRRWRGPVPKINSGSPATPCPREGK